MRLIRNLLLLTFVGIAVVAAYAWTDRSRLREKAVDYAAETAKREAVEGASRVAEKAGETVDTRRRQDIRRRAHGEDQVEDGA